MLGQPSKFFRASQIAMAAGVCSKTIHRLALRGGWPSRRDQNRREYRPPQGLLAKCRESQWEGAGGVSPSAVLAARPSVFRAMAREQAVLHFRLMLEIGQPVQKALA